MSGLKLPAASVPRVRRALLGYREEMDGRSLLLELRAQLRPEPGSSRLLVDSLGFHALCVRARGRLTVAERPGRAFHELEKVAYRRGRLRAPDWSLPGKLTTALVAWGLLERLDDAERRALRRWHPFGGLEGVSARRPAASA